MSKSKDLGHLLDLICECLKKDSEVLKTLGSRIDILKEEVVGLQKGLSMLNDNSNANTDYLMERINDIERRVYDPEWKENEAD